MKDFKCGEKKSVCCQNSPRISGRRICAKSKIRSASVFIFFSRSLIIRFIFFKKNNFPINVAYEFGANAENHYYPLPIYKIEGKVPPGKLPCVEPIYLQSCNEFAVRRATIHSMKKNFILGGQSYIYIELTVLTFLDRNIKTTIVFLIAKPSQRASTSGYFFEEGKFRKREVFFFFFFFFLLDWWVL